MAARVFQLIVVAFIALPLVGSHFAQAQSDGDDVTIGNWREIESKVLGEKRKIIVSKPTGYDTSKKRYAVVYVLDGDAHFHHTTGLVDFLTTNDRMPDALVVAVPNTDRTRDLTPPKEDHDPEFPTAGGANNFIKFFQEELIPFVDDNYRTHPYRVLVGHSFGGLFAVHTLVHQPETFNAYIAISPSFQWDDQKLVQQAESFLHGSPVLDRTLYMTVGNEGSQLLGGVLKIAGILEEKSPDSFHWDSRVMKEETHGTVPYRSTRQGLEFVFRDWDVREPVKVYDLGGTAAIHNGYAKATERYGIKRKTPPIAFLQLIFQLTSKGRMDEARKVLEHDKEKYPPQAIGYSILAKAYLQHGDKDAAIDCFTRELQLNPASENAKQKLQTMGVDVASLVKTVTVPEKILQEYCGEYSIAGSNTPVQVFLEDNKLFIEGPGLPKMELTAVSETKFTVSNGVLKLTFDRGDDGKVSKCTADIVNGNKIVFSRADSDDAEREDQ